MAFGLRLVCPCCEDWSDGVPTLLIRTEPNIGILIMKFTKESPNVKILWINSAKELYYLKSEDVRISLLKIKCNNLRDMPFSLVKRLNTVSGSSVNKIF